MEMNKIPELLTIKETAERTGLPKYFVRKLVLDNKIKHFKAGKKNLINIKHLIEYLNNDEKVKEEN